MGRKLPPSRSQVRARPRRRQAVTRRTPLKQWHLEVLSDQEFYELCTNFLLGKDIGAVNGRTAAIGEVTDNSWAVFSPIRNL